MKRFLFLSALIIATNLAMSQKKEKVFSIKVSNTHAVFLGNANPKSEHFKKTPHSQRNKMRQDKKLPPNFIGRGKSKAIIAELEHQGPDPLRQTKMSNNSGTIIEPLVNVDGLFNSFGSPHDPSGSIGTNHYVQAINATVIGVFDKSGTKLSEFAANSLWEPLGESSLGDPIVMFDHENNQWIITEFAEPALLLIAVSVTDDPLGDYNVYSFATPNFPDYPKYAIWSDFIIVTTNETGPGNLHQYFIDRAALMAGDEDVTIQRVEISGNTSTEAGFYVTTPVHWNGATAPVDNNPIAVKINDSSWGEVAVDAVEIFSFDVDLDDPSNTTVEKITLETTAFDGYPCDNESGGFACLSQGGNGSGGLDAIPEVIMNIPHYRNFETHESIVLNFITDITNGDNLSGIRWMELRRTTGNDWSIYQEGTFAPDDGLHRFMGSIGIDEKGNIGMAYNVSSPTEFAGIRFTGRFESDPLGQMTVDEYVVIAGTNFINTDRFGDYPHITVDPVDGQTFWYTAEYGGNGSNNSKTRLVAFQLEKKDNDLAVVSISSPNTSVDLTATEQVTAEIINTGNLSATGFDILLSLDGNEIETFTYSEALNSGATYEHTFATTLDLSSIGSYDINVSIIYDSDESAGNNTKTKTVKKLALLDGAISIDVDSETCSESLSGIVRLSNEGANEITSAQIELFVDGTSVNTIDYSGSINTGEKDEIEVTFDGLADGSNIVSASLTMINDSADEFAENNIANASIIFDASLVQVLFTLTTDEYPAETTWQITNMSDEVVFSGGPYVLPEATIVEKLCLSTDQCYIFTLYDSESDGICCDFGEGSFSLTDSDGNNYFESNGEFESSQDALICLGDSNFPSNDASVTLVTNDVNACLAEVPTVIEIKNEGEDALTSLSVDVYFNSTLQETIEWAGNLTFGEIAKEEISFMNLTEGENTITIEAKSPNGMTDENPDNNVDEVTIDNADNLMSIEVSIVTDGFPEETRWGIFDDEENLLAVYGPYDQTNATINEQLCLLDESCYTFLIVDAYGDGIENGSFSLTDSFGDILISGNGDFGSGIEVDFCLDAVDACKLNVSIEAEDAGSGESNGSILITATGATSLQFSIDGGLTFQSDNLFENLEEGSYDVVVKVSNECLYEETVVVNSVCMLAATIETVDAGSSVSGSIIITVTGATNVQYSIDGGETFQDENLFDGLSEGSYDVLVKSTDECLYEETVTINKILGINKKVISISPNPTEGLFQIRFTSENSKNEFLEMQLMDLNGKIIQTRKFSRYDNEYVGTVSLVAYPKGVYIMRISNSSESFITKVIKE